MPSTSGTTRPKVFRVSALSCAAARVTSWVSSFQPELKRTAVRVGSAFSSSMRALSLKKASASS